jgi:hypothetical protein
LRSLWRASTSITLGLVIDPRRPEKGPRPAAGASDAPPSLLGASLAPRHLRLLVAREADVRPRWPRLLRACMTATQSERGCSERVLDDSAAGPCDAKAHSGGVLNVDRPSVVHVHEVDMLVRNTSSTSTSSSTDPSRHRLVGVLPRIQSGSSQADFDASAAAFDQRPAWQWGSRA